MIPTINIILLIAYFVIVLIIGLISRRKETSEGYLIADRKLNGFQLMTTLVASMTGSITLVTFAAFFYLFGISAIWSFIGLAVGFWLFIPLALRLKRVSKRYYTFSDYFYEKYGFNVGMFLTCIIFIYILLAVVIHLAGGASILSTITGLSYFTALIIGSSIIIIYMYLGGFKAVIKTDVFQYLIIMILFVLGIFMVTKTGVLAEQLNLFGMGVGKSIGFFILGVFIVFIKPDFWQRVYAAKNERDIKIGFGFSSIFIILVGLSVALISFAVRNTLTNIDPNATIAYGFSQLLPIGLSGIALVILFAAIMSSVDTLTFVLATNVSKDFISRIREISKQQFVKITRYSIIIIGLLAMFIAFFFKDVTQIFSALTNLSFVLVPTIIGSFIWKLKNKAIFLSVISGIIIGVPLLIKLGLEPQIAFLTLPISTIFLFIGQKVFKN